MPKGIRLAYDDDWIYSHWDDCRNWLTLCNAYNSEHETEIPYCTFKSHCNRELKLNYHYTVEQEAFLAETYPRFGRVKTAEMFNQQFNDNKSPGAIKIHCQQKLGLRVIQERRKETAIENTGRIHQEGTIVFREHGEPYIKTCDGWARLKETILKRESGKIIVHLDGNVNNCQPKNLVVISRKTCARMTKNKFWSEESEITMTGIIWCELDAVLKGEMNDGDTSPNFR